LRDSLPSIGLPVPRLFQAEAREHGKDVWLRVAASAATPVLRVQWEIEIATYLVQGDPILDPITVSFKEQAGVRDEIIDDLALVVRLPSSVSLLQLEREVPVVQRDPGCDALSEQSVDQLIVVCQTRFVHRIIFSSQRFDSGPRDGEPVRVGSVQLEELDVLPEEVVRVDGLVPVLLVLEVFVPDGKTPAVVLISSLTKMCGSRISMSIHSCLHSTGLTSI
jgi:hypothetical protein